MNSDKCHFLSLSNKIPFKNFDIKNKHSQKLLSVTTDHKLNFHDHASILCKNASAKISTMGKTIQFMLLNQRN